MRVDSGCGRFEVTPLYDPMVAKLITWDVDRERATASRMLRALGDYEIEPLTTLIPFHRAILATEHGRGARPPGPDRGPRVAEVARAPRTAAPEGGRARRRRAEAERTYAVEVDGRLHSVKVIGDRADRRRRRPGRCPPKRQRSGSGGGGGGGPTLTSPLQGSVFKVVAEQGAEVEEGALICVIEAMKMENEITAHRAGKITELNVSEGAAISTSDPIATIE